MALDPRLLRSFVVLAEELHFGRAAQRLNLAQPGLSQQVRRLEQQIGTPLYVRSSRSVELTHAGRAMLEPARAAVRASEQAERAVREATRALRHPLRIGVDFALDDVVPTLAAYNTSRSDVSLWVSRMHEIQGHRMLEADQVDAFIGFLPPTDSSELPRVRGMDVSLWAVVHLDDPIAERSSVSLTRFRRSPVVIASREQEPERFDYFVGILSEGQGRHALSLREIHTTGTAAQGAVLAEVGAGQAVSFGSPGKPSTGPPDLRFLPFDPPLQVPTYISWHPERSTNVDRFIEHLTARD